MPDADADPIQTLDRALLTGLAWTGGVKWMAQLVSWAATLIVARLITPTDYGLFAMAMVYAGFVQLVNELGLSLAIVQYRELNSRQIAQLGGLALLVGVFLFGVSLALSGPIAAFFGEDAVRWIVIALSLTFVMRAVQVVPRSLMARDLEFRRLAWIDACEAFVWSSVTLIGALFGLGYWALVLGAVVSGGAVMVVLCVRRPHRVSWPHDIGSIAHAIRLGWYVVVSQLCWYVYTHAALTIVGQVTPGVFSAAQHDRATLRRYLLALTEGLALLTFPMSVGLALVADLFVIVVLGAQWVAAIVPLRVLGLYGGFRAIFNPLPQMLVATGHAKRNMRFNLVAAVVLPTLLWLGSRWGVPGVALAWIVGYPLVTVPTFFRSTPRILELRPRTYLRTLWPATSAAAGIAVVVVALRDVTPASWPAVARLALEVIGGAVAYVSVLALGHRDPPRVGISP